MTDKNWEKLKTQSISDKDRERMTDSVYNTKWCRDVVDGLNDEAKMKVLFKACDHIDKLEADKVFLLEQGLGARNDALEEAAEIVENGASQSEIERKILRKRGGVEYAHDKYLHGVADAIRALKEPE